MAKFQNKKYASGEYYCLIQETIEAAVIIGNMSHSNQMEFFSVIDAAIRAGAKDITLIIPYFAYARQDKMEAPYSSVGFEVLAKVINVFKIDRLVTIDLHSPQSLSLFDCEVVNVGLDLIFSGLPHQSFRFSRNNGVVITPDIGSYNRNKHLNPICLNKKRMGDSIVFSLSQSIKGKSCFLVDDIIDSGKTISCAIDFLYQNGASEVKAYVTHILKPDIPKEVILTTDSLKPRDDIQVIKVSEILRKFL